MAISVVAVGVGILRTQGSGSSGQGSGRASKGENRWGGSCTVAPGRQYNCRPNNKQLRDLLANFAFKS
jgi:hypothetical protein